jgi:peptidoglycan/LPS O-acetylase OafA/YrhL
LRIIATLCVFLGHCNFPWLGNGIQIGPNNGQDFVIVFFVLSGFVIAYVTDKKKDASLKRYLFDRFTRLYSVVIPALILTYISDSIGQKVFSQDLYNGLINENYLSIRYLLNLSFFQESWTLSTRPGTNGPFWSLAYEFWFYMAFGIWFYIKNIKFRSIFLILIMALTGYKIWILFPCWLLGVATYYMSKKQWLNQSIAFTTCLISMGILVAVLNQWASLPTWKIFPAGNAPLFYSSNFLHDYILAGILAIFIYSFTHLKFNKSVPTILSNFIKRYANSTFSLYLYHFPLLVLVASIIQYFEIRISHAYQLWLVALSVLLIIYPLSAATEKRLPDLRKLLMDKMRI